MNPGGPKRWRTFSRPRKYAQQGVEAGEVIHVGVGDEGVGHLQQLARRQRRKIAEIEEQGPALEKEIHVDPGIPERIVDQAWVEEGLHGRSRTLPR